jgi:hypothetical protein
MLLAHRLRLQLALKRIIEVVDERETEMSAEEALIQIGNIAEAALIL